MRCDRCNTRARCSRLCTSMRWGDVAMLRRAREGQPFGCEVSDHLPSCQVLRNSLYTDHGRKPYLRHSKDAGQSCSKILYYTILSLQLSLAAGLISAELLAAQMTLSTELFSRRNCTLNILNASYLRLPTFLVQTKLRSKHFGVQVRPVTFAQVCLSLPKKLDMTAPQN